jgi:hypothetical protein
MDSVHVKVEMVQTKVDSVHTKVASVDNIVKCKCGYSWSLAIEQRDMLASNQDREIVKWLSGLNFWAKQNDTLERHQEGTGQWFLEHPTFQSLVTGDTTATSWCIPLSLY